MRIVSALAAALLLAALLVMGINAGPESRLIIVYYDGWEQLRQLASLGLQILNYQGDVLAALSYDEQIEALRRVGFPVRIVDPAAEPQAYYLAYPYPASDRSALCEAEAAYPYASDVFIVRATPARAERLALRGVDIVKLPRSIALPSPQPMTAALQASPAYSPAVQAMVDAVSPTLLIHHVCKLQDRDQLTYCNELGTRFSYASTGIDEAAQYLYDEHRGLGLLVMYDPFLHNSTPMTNVVAELPGVGPDSNHVYVLSAHYDSLSEDPENVAPGADDNASGCAAVLEAARILSQHEFSHTIRFIHFAGEEQGLFGSAHYAEQALQRGDWIDGVVNLDMIAFESVPPADHIVEIHAGTDPSSLALADAFIGSILDYGLLLTPQEIGVGATWRADHSSFWSRGYPAILGIEDFDDFNPHYHGARDTLANMNTQLMVEYTKAAVATIAELASSHRSSPTPTPTPTLAPLRMYLPLVNENSH